MTRERKRTYYERLILAGALLFLGGALSWARFQEHGAVSARESKHLVDQVMTLDATLYQQLDAVNRALITIRALIPSWQAHGKLREMAAPSLSAFAQTMVGVRTFAIVDRQGLIIASSNPSLLGMDVSALPYFIEAQPRQHVDVLHVNAPVKTPQGQWLIAFSREFLDDQNHFQGLIIAAWDPGVFELLLSSLRYADDMSVSLAHGAGIRFLTLPNTVQAAPGTRLVGGISSRLQPLTSLLMAEEVQGGEVRFVVAKRLQPPLMHMDKPLLLELSRSKTAMYAEWLSTSITWMGGYLVVVLCSILGLLIVQGRRRELRLITYRNERALHEKNQALEAANRLLMSQQEKLQSMVFVDGLTGIANRRRFDEALSREWAHCHRTQSPISLLMLDLDHFKQLNDHYGHQAGDYCLKQVAQVLQSELHRPHDLAARYGGEEFVCLLPECDVEDARIKAEQIRLAIEALAIPNVTASEQGVLTTSIGLACTVPLDIEQSEILFSLADTALYRAKANGRNCVVLAASSPA